MWNIEATGYKPLTNIYENFSIAEMFGINELLDTYYRLFEQFKDDYKILTELSMALNWKSWEHYKTNEKIARLYDKLWKEVDQYAIENLKDDEQSYYLSTTD